MILSAKATEVVIEEIHEYLAELGERVRNGLKPVEDFIIYKVRISTEF
jgi:DNA polymerase alpha subunit A